MTGLQIRNMQMLDDLQKIIKEFELKRIETDLLNTDKYADLYEVYYKLLDKYWQINNKLVKCKINILAYVIAINFL